MTLLLFSAIIFFIAVTGPYVFGDIGIAITSFFVGLFGFFVYPLLLLAIYYSVVLVSGRKYFPAIWVLKIMLFLAAVFFIVHTATAERFYGNGYGSYLGGCWSAASERIAQGTGGGVVFGLIAYPVRAVLSAAGSYVLYSLLVAGMLFWIAMGTPLRKIVFRSGARMQDRTARDREAQPVSYDDIPAPERSATLPEMPARPVQAAPAAYAQAAQPVRPAPIVGIPVQPAPSARRTAQPASASAELSADEKYRRSREILFSSDPASSYRNNLIYDRDSRFNTYPRRSSVTPVSSPESVSPASPVSDKPTAAPARYSEDYAARTSEGRPSMPRRVTVERPAPAPMESDLNYPQSPSYRAPVQPAAEEHDYYANDVPYTETFSSEPNIDDYDVPAEPAHPASAEPARVGYETPAEPVRPTYGAESVRPAYEAPAEPVRPTYEPPAEPARPTYEAESVRPAYEAPAEPARPTYQAEPVRPAYETPAEPAQAEAADDAPMTREEYRSVFSRPVPERICIEDTPAPEPPARADRFSAAAQPVPTASEETEELPQGSRVFDSPVRGSAADLFDEPEIDDANYLESETVSETSERNVRAGRGMERPLGDRSAVSERGARDSAPAAADESGPAPAPKKHVYKAYVRPDLENLVTYQEKSSVSQEEIDQNSAIIVETLSAFRVDAEVVKVTVGSAVTRYDIDIPRNVTVNTVIKRDTEIAMRLHARDGVNIYSNSEAGAISIEVPNSRRATVGLKSVMQSEEYVKAKPNALAFAMGKDVEGRNVCGNIVKMKHLLVAGSTGSGKSVCLNSMLISLICKYSPEDLRLILIDPKKVEFAVFDGLPHLMINEIISDAQKAISALNWAIKEQERRYTLFQNKTRSGINVHNLDEYNASLTEDEEKLAKIVIVVDELADLMSVAKKEIEERIQRLAQKARAAGMHLVIATQRPSVDVITGVIKGNLPTRLAFRVIQEVDSRTILDESGAQKLLGNGDMLYRTEGMFNCLRVQGAFVGSDEVQKIVEDIKAHNEAYFDENVADFINREESGSAGGGMSDDADDCVDPQYIKALAIVVKLGQASISLIQRKCSVGYNHAGKIIEWMELMGYISAFDGKAKARTVLLSKEDFEAKYGDLD